MSIWSPTIPKRAIAAIAVTLAAAGCAPPTMDGAGFQHSALDGPEQLSSVTLCLINPNPDALVFRRVQVILDRADTPLATGSSNAAIIVPALSSTRMPLAVLPAGQAGSVRAGDVGYHVDGLVGLDRAFGLSIPYRHTGHLDAVFPAASGVLYHCAERDIAVPL